MRFALVILFMFGLFAGAMFGSAGRVDLPFFWAWLGVILAGTAVAVAGMPLDLRAERMKPGPGGCDRNLRPLVTPFLLGHVVIAGLDAGRFHWSDAVPSAVQVAGVVGFAAGLALPIWAMRVNRFFSPVVRIQHERGHHLIDRGPYRFIRHPGYAGLLLGLTCGGLALGSWLALAVLIVPVVMVLRRLFIEDRFLHEHLEGYRDYAARVRARLVPGVW